MGNPQRCNCVECDWNVKCSPVRIPSTRDIWTIFLKNHSVVESFIFYMQGSRCKKTQVKGPEGDQNSSESTNGHSK